MILLWLYPAFEGKMQDVVRRTPTLPLSLPLVSLSSQDLAVAVASFRSKDAERGPSDRVLPLSLPLASLPPMILLWL